MEETDKGDSRIGRRGTHRKEERKVQGLRGRITGAVVNNKAWDVFLIG